MEIIDPQQKKEFEERRLAAKAVFKTTVAVAY